MESLMRCEFVKIKKLLALALSAVMAVSMLTACGGGGKAGSLNLGEVNSVISEYGGETRVKNSNTLNNALRSVADTLQKNGTYTTDAGTAALEEIRGYPIQENGNNWVREVSGGVMVLSDAELKAEGMTAEDAVGIMIAAVEYGLDEQLAGFQNLNFTIVFYAGATTVTAENGTLYWVIGYEFDMKASA